jgi:hypothetical protein
MKLLNNINMLKNFKLINTDNNQNIPAQITAVPTLIVAGCQKMFVCDEAFKWVNNIILINQQNQEQNKNNVNIASELTNDNNNNSEADKIGAIEKNYFSDLFTSVDNNNLPQNNEYIDPAKKQNYIFTAPELGKIDMQTQIKEVNEAIAKRNAQDKENKEHIRRQKKEQESAAASAAAAEPIKKKNYY